MRVEVASALGHGRCPVPQQAVPIMTHRKLLGQRPQRISHHLAPEPLVDRDQFALPWILPKEIACSGSTLECHVAAASTVKKVPQLDPLYEEIWVGLGCVASSKPRASQWAMCAARSEVQWVCVRTARRHCARVADGAFLSDHTNATQQSRIWNVLPERQVREVHEIRTPGPAPMMQYLRPERHRARRYRSAACTRPSKSNVHEETFERAARVLARANLG